MEQQARFDSRAEELFERLRVNLEAEVDRLIADSQGEAYFLDFKTAEKHAGSSLGSSDRKNLAKALSGFSNSEGGVLIWGVGTRRGTDVAGGKEPIADPQGFAAGVLSAVTALTVPPAESVDAIAIASGTAPDRGYVAVYIPKGIRGPLQVIGEGKYYIRVGNSFQPAPHGVVAGMFGRSPQPVVFHRFGVMPATPFMREERMTVRVQFQVLLTNGGPVIAEGMYASMIFRSLAKDSIEAILQASAAGHAWHDPQNPPQDRRWIQSNASIHDLSLVATPEYRLAPRGHAQAFVVNLFFPLDPRGDFSFEIVSGCSGAPPMIRTHRVEKERIEQLVQEAVAGPPASDVVSVDNMQRIAAQLLDIEPKWPQFEGISS